MQSVQNLGLAVFSLVSGVLLEEYGYFVLELFFLCLCIAGLIFAFVLYFVDKFKGNFFSQFFMIHIISYIKLNLLEIHS